MFGPYFCINDGVDPRPDEMWYECIVDAVVDGKHDSSKPLHLHDKDSRFTSIFFDRYDSDDDGYSELVEKDGHFYAIFVVRDFSIQRLENYTGQFKKIFSMIDFSEK